MRPIVYYHGLCNDGMGAAYAAWRHYGDNADYVPLSYGDPTPTPEQVEGREVVVMDFSFEPKLTSQLIASAQSFLLLDHHKSAMHAWAKFWLLDPQAIQHVLTNCDYLDTEMSEDVRVLFDLNKSGAALAWEHFHPGTELPDLLKFVQDYDLGKTFNGSAIPGTEGFIHRLELEERSLAAWAALVPALSRERVADFLQEGELLIQARNQWAEQILAKQTSTVTLGGIRGLAINGGQGLVDELGHRLAKLSGTFGMLWTVRGDRVNISLRAHNQCDVGELAVKYGGGGHPNAAGIVLPLDRFLTEVLN